MINMSAPFFSITHVDYLSIEVSFLPLPPSSIFKRNCKKNSSMKIQGRFYVGVSAVVKVQLKVRKIRSELDL